MLETPTRGSLDAEEKREYIVDAPSGSWLEAVLQTKNGEDLVLDLEDDQGLLLSIDEVWQDDTEMLIFGPTNEATYRIRVRALDSATYTLTVRSLTELSPRQQAWARAQALHQQATPESLEQAAETWLEIDEPARSAHSWSRLADKQSKDGRHLADAIEAYSAVITTLGTSYPTWVAATHNRRGLLWRQLGEAERATKDFQTALQLFSSHAHAPGTASSLNNFALANEDAGDLDGAQSYYERALRILPDSSAAPVLSEKAKILENLARLATVQNRRASALRYLDQAVRLRRQAGDDLNRLHHEKAWLLILDERPAEALAALDQVQARLDDAQTVTAMVVAQRRGIALEALDRIDEALVAYSQADDLARHGGHQLDAVGLDITTCRLAARYPTRELYAACDRAIDVMHDLADPSRKMSGLYWHAHTLIARQRQEEALATLEQAGDLLESLRLTISGRESRARFHESRADITRLRVDTLMQSYFRSDEVEFARFALEAGDSLRARGIMDGEAGSAPPRRDQHQAELRREIEAIDRARVTALRTRDIGGVATDAFQDESPEAILLDRLDRLDLADGRQQRQAEAQSTSSRGQATSLATQPLQLVQTALADSTVILSLLTGETNSYLWVVRSDGIFGKLLPGRATLEARALAFYTSLSAGDRDGAWTTGRRLSQTLFGAGLNSLAIKPGERLVLVGDGEFQQLPLSALPLASATPSRPRFLAEEHEVVHAPSLGALLALRQRPSTATRSVAIVADPLYRLDHRRVGPLQRLDDDEVASVFGDRLPVGGVARLAYSELEAQLVAKQVPEPFIATGLEATRSLAVSSSLDDFAIVHIASHGLLDPQIPSLSAILLTEFDADGKTIGGELRLVDLFDLSWQADLVVASACHTGAGGELRLEGARGLARGFLQAGIPRAIVSMWQVDSHATAHFMEAFYSGLFEQRLAPGAALRYARLHLLKGDDPRRRAWSSPHIWGAFVLVGDWRHFSIPVNI